jgi:hypothetical protein
LNLLSRAAARTAIYPAKLWPTMANLFASISGRFSLYVGEQLHPLKSGFALAGGIDRKRGQSFFQQKIRNGVELYLSGSVEPAQQYDARRPGDPWSFAKIS